MARVAGRSSWVAVPVGLLCAAVVAALVWLALPMGPAVLAWLGETVRAASASAPFAAPESPAPTATAVDLAALECRTFYPADLWVELAWTPDALLSQTQGPPVTSVASLAEALEPVALLTCAWRASEGARTISSTLATVADGAAPVAEAALRGQGFACDADDGILSCVRTQGDVVEEHVVRDGFWLSSVETAWPIERYGERLAAHLFE